MDKRTLEGLVGCPADLGRYWPALPHGRLDSHRDTLSSASFLLHPQDGQTQRPIMKMKNPGLSLK